jgi:hypothetical protein
MRLRTSYVVLYTGIMDLSASAKASRLEIANKLRTFERRTHLKINLDYNQKKSTDNRTTGETF